MSFVFALSAWGMIASTDACRVAKRSARGGKGNRRSAQAEVQVHAKEQ